MSVNIPKFILNDIPIFKSITSDLFAKTLGDDDQNDVLKKTLIQVCQENAWDPNEVVY